MPWAVPSRTAGDFITLLRHFCFVLHFIYFYSKADLQREVREERVHLLVLSPSGCNNQS